MTPRILGIVQSGLARSLVSIVAAVAVALIATNYRIDEIRRDDSLPANASIIRTNQRATIQLAPVTIQPTVSGNGTVQPGTAPNTWILEAAVQPQDLAYQLLTPPVSVKALIDGGPAGFDCPWDGLGTSGDGVTMRCKIPSNVKVVEGLQGTMSLQMAPPVTAQGLPLSAVLGTTGQGVVVIVKPDGSLEPRTVVLGRSDSLNVEVVSGLAAGEKVLAVPVQRDFGSAAP